MKNQRSKSNSMGCQQWSSSTNNSGGNRPHRRSAHCQFCNILGHKTKYCRKLAWFLRDNYVTTTPISNATTSRPASSSITWMFDTGVSHHITSDKSSLHTLSEYGDQMKLFLVMVSLYQYYTPVMHASSRPLSLPGVLYVPKLRNNLILVAKLCQTNHVSIEFFPIISL